MPNPSGVNGLRLGSVPQDAQSLNPTARFRQQTQQRLARAFNPRPPANPHEPRALELLALARGAPPGLADVASEIETRARHMLAYNRSEIDAAHLAAKRHLR